MLLAGDSFGQSPKGHEHHTFYALKKIDYPEDFDHWCELWAKDLDMQVVNHSVSGRCISSTSFIAMQQLMMNNYDVCVYHVSHHGRTVHNKPKDLDEWKEKLFPLLGHVDGRETLDKIYDNDNYPLFNHELLPDVHTSNTCAGPNPGEIAINGDATYITTKAPFSYIHDAVGSVLALKALCEAKGVRLQLVKNFGHDTCDAIRNLGIDIDFFDANKSEVKHDFTARDGMYSHYNKAEHELIYSDFCEYLKKSK